MIMKYAKITGGIVEQVQPYPEAGFVEVPGGTVPGMIDNDDGTFSVPAPDPAPIPQTVTRYQAMAALHNAGLLDSVEALMLDPGTDRLAVLEWQHRDTFGRTSATLTVMAGTLGLTDADLDDLFVAAAAL